MTTNETNTETNEPSEDSLLGQLDAFFDTVEEEHGIEPSETAEETGRRVAHLHD